MSLTKILAVLLAALAFVACEEEPDTPLAHLYPIDYINDPLDFDGDTLDVIHHCPTVVDSGYYVVSNKRDFDRYFSEGKYDVDIDFDVNNAVIINGTSNYGVAFAKVRIDETDGAYKYEVLRDLKIASSFDVTPYLVECRTYSIGVIEFFFCNTLTIDESDKLISPQSSLHILYDLFGKQMVSPIYEIPLTRQLK